MKNDVSVKTPLNFLQEKGIQCQGLWQFKT